MRKSVARFALAIPGIPRGSWAAATAAGTRGGSRRMGGSRRSGRRRIAGREVARIRVIISVLFLFC
jgi:hypothetical protein